MEKNKESTGPKALTKEEEVDNRLAVALGRQALNSPDLKKALSGMLKSAEPKMAAGQLVANLVLNLRGHSYTNGLNFSDNIWAAEGGVIDQLSDTTASLAGDEGLSSPIWEEAVNVLKLAEQAQKNEKAGPPQPGGMPPAAGGGAAGPNIMSALGGGQV